MRNKGYANFFFWRGGGRGRGGGGNKVHYGICASDERNNLINFTLRSLVNYDTL